MRPVHSISNVCLLVFASNANNSALSAISSAATGASKYELTCAQSALGPLLLHPYQPHVASSCKVAHHSSVPAVSLSRRLPRRLQLSSSPAVYGVPVRRTVVLSLSCSLSCPGSLSVVSWLQLDQFRTATMSTPRNPKHTHFCNCHEKCGGGKPVTQSVFNKHTRFRAGANQFVAPGLVADRSEFARLSRTASQAPQASGSGAMRTPPPGAPGPPGGSAAPVHSPPGSPPTAPSTPKRPRRSAVCHLYCVHPHGY